MPMRSVETAAFPTVEWASYEETPVCWLQTDQPYAAGVMFRAGVADETLTTRGITHLVEHLALQRFGDARYHFNGGVGPTTTTFYASGRPDEVVSFIERAVASVGRLSTDRLGSELKVMRIEDEARADSVAGRLLRLTFGFRDYGLIGTDDLGLATLEPPVILWRARTAFTRRNAVVWVVGEPPAQLDLQIPTGAWMPPPPVTGERPRPGRRLVRVGSGSVAIGMVVERSEAARMAIGIVADRAHRLLREQRGLSYAVQTEWVPLDGGVAHATLMADCVDEDAELVARLLVETLERMASIGPTWDELERIDEDELETLRRAESHVAVLHAGAHDYLLGRTPRSITQRIIDRRAVDEGAVALALRPGIERALMTIPLHTAWSDHRWVEFQPPVGQVHGRSFKERGEGRLGGIRGRTGGSTIVVGPGGICVTDAFGPWSYAIPSIAGYAMRSDGTRLVLCFDGYRFLIDPDSWVDGGDLVRLLDRLIPTGLRILPL